MSLWGLNLVTQYHDALSLDIQEMLLLDNSYTTPALFKLITRESQLDALRTLRVSATRHYSSLRAQERLVQRTLSCKMKTAGGHYTAVIQPPPTTNSQSVAPPVPGKRTDDISALTAGT